MSEKEMHWALPPDLIETLENVTYWDDEPAWPWPWTWTYDEEEMWWLPILGDLIIVNTTFSP